MDWCGLSPDGRRNFDLANAHPGEVIPMHGKRSALELLIAGTDEKTVIERETFEVIRNAS